MPTSPLGAAYLTGNEPTAGYMDPTLLQAMPDVQLGQSMQQGAMSTAPAYPMQAAARLAEALSGAYIQHQALSDLGRAYTGVPKEMANLLEKNDPKNPLIPLLRSDRPVIQNIAMNLANKVVPLRAEIKDLSPGQKTVTGSDQINNGPQTDMGKAARDAAEARANGNEEAAEAIEREAGLKTHNQQGILAPRQPLTPNSSLPLNPPRVSQPGASQNASGLPLSPPRVAPVSTVPTPSIPKGAVRPPSPTAAIPPPSAGNAAPPTTNQQSLNQTDQQNAPALAQAKQSYADQIIAAKAKQTAADEAAKAGVEYGDLLKPQTVGQGPGQTEPLTTTRGTTIPALADQAPIPTNPAQLKTKIPEWQKTASEWTSALKSGQMAEQRLNTIAGAFQAIQTGSFTTNKADWQAKLNAVGIHFADNVLSDPTKVQLGLHENYAETMEQLKANTPRFTQQEFKITSENKQHPNLQPGANLQMIAEDLAPIRQTRDLATDWTAAQRQGWRDPQSFESAWLRQNKLSDYVKRAKDEIGPLKGMPGNPATGGAPTAPATTVHSPSAVEAEMKRRGLLPNGG